MVDLDFLKKVSLFKGVDENQLVKIQEGCLEREYKNGERLFAEGIQRGWRVFFPEYHYSTDNAAMIAITGYYKYLNHEFAPLDISPAARFKF